MLRPSQSKLTAPFQPPKILKTKRRSSNFDRDEERSTANAKGQHKKQRLGENSTVESDSDFDEDECVPMSESQLQRHTKVPATSLGATVSAARSLPGLSRSPNESKILAAKLERMGMRNQAVEHKQVRNHPVAAAHPNQRPVNSGNGCRYILCLYRDQQTKKHKTWDGDACLIIGKGLQGNKLVDTDNKHW
jgi:hypothetical protein